MSIENRERFYGFNRSSIEIEELSEAENSIIETVTSQYKWSLWGEVKEALKYGLKSIGF